MWNYDRTTAFRSDFTALRKELADTKAGPQKQIASRSEAMLKLDTQDVDSSTKKTRLRPSSRGSRPMPMSMALGWKHQHAPVRMRCVCVVCWRLDDILARERQEPWIGGPRARPGGPARKVVCQSLCLKDRDVHHTSLGSRIESIEKSLPAAKKKPFFPFLSFPFPRC